MNTPPIPSSPHDEAAPRSCPDCGSPAGSLSRRRFLAATGSALGAATIAGGSRLFAAQDLIAKAAELPKSERLLIDLHASLTDEQLKTVVFPFDHELRSRVENNWHIVPQRVGEFFNADQQAIIKEMFLNLHSEEYRDKVWQQFIHDNTNKKSPTEEAAFGSAAVAIFGAPGSGKFEFVFTGRHCTRRCDADSVAGAAFGGPIFYGHSAQGFYEKPDHPGNVYWFQAQRANEVFQALDGKQREVALLGDSRGERGVKTVALKGSEGEMEGIPVAGLAADQKELVGKVLTDLLAPFRDEDRQEARKMIEGDLENLHMAFFKNEDVGKDGVWDVWQIEGPHMVWYFRGDPHVHTWVNIKAPGPKSAA